MERRSNVFLWYATMRYDTMRYDTMRYATMRYAITGIFTNKKMA